MNAQSQLYGVLADAVLLVHFAFVVFVLGGLALIWVGYFLRWRIVRNVWFRLAHLAAIGVVVAESFLGMVCPLTTWEEKLRLLAGEGQRYGGSFIQHWVHRVMFFEAPEAVFTLVYAAFFLLVLASFWVVKPDWRRGAPSSAGASTPA